MPSTITLWPYILSVNAEDTSVHDCSTGLERQDSGLRVKLPTMIERTLHRDPKDCSKTNT